MTAQPTPPEPIYEGLVGEHGDVVAAARHASEQLQQQPALGLHGENLGTANPPVAGPFAPQPLSAGEQLSEPGSSGSVAEEPAEPFDGTAGPDPRSVRFP